MKARKQICEITITSGARDDLVDISFTFTPALDMKDDAKNHRGVVSVAFAMMDFANNNKGSDRDKYACEEKEHRSVVAKMKRSK